MIICPVCKSSHDTTENLKKCPVCGYKMLDENEMSFDNYAEGKCTSENTIPVGVSSHEKNRTIEVTKHQNTHIIKDKSSILTKKENSKVENKISSIITKEETIKKENQQSIFKTGPINQNKVKELCTESNDLKEVISVCLGYQLLGVLISIFLRGDFNFVKLVLEGTFTFGNYIEVVFSLLLSIFVWGIVGVFAAKINDCFPKRKTKKNRKKNWFNEHIGSIVFLSLLYGCCTAYVVIPLVLSSKGVGDMPLILCILMYHYTMGLIIMFVEGGSLILLDKLQKKKQSK